MEAKFKVHGMKCQKCVDKIEKFVGEIDGVEFIDVDLQASCVRVVFDEDSKLAMIKEAILDSGFEIAQ